MIEKGMKELFRGMPATEPVAHSFNHIAKVVYDAIGRLLCQNIRSSFFYRIHLGCIDW
jgi:hypothetical protein